MIMPMLAALIHWRVKPEQEHVDAFLDHWKNNNRVDDRRGLIAEFLSDPLDTKSFPHVTWHLDGESLGDFKSYVTVGLWSDADEFEKQIAQHFNDGQPLKSFEKYRRRRVVFHPVGWRVGDGDLPEGDSEGVV